MDLETEALIAEARVVRLELALGRTPEEVAVATQHERCKEMAKHLKAAGLKPRRVYASFEPDERGLLEVLFTAGDGPTYVNGVEQAGTPMTAYMRGTELAYEAEGW